ncbi:hypothetical protein KMZ32_00740 [Phycicoccus sp. MAQZ13P-2]|uniref:hypothetical protein n=1 Tax=Phycicoccus mangrovi TaxID=2840470 RepID=UPI001BFFE707|nr:hypothetical protein [Phycicoccus mangrovi]MBT9254217.1 hypothetical protein [Phycicoccus mangrovi]MBT9272595.1 hypothetical protein [Phycicoccus mangrovi]
MQRFVWVAWGLLVVVVDLPLDGWDVLPDVVGYAWVIYGLTGAAGVHPAFVRARSAAVVGIPVWAVLGTPLFASPRYGTLLVTALTVQVVVTTLLVHQVCTGILATAPADDPDSARWARILRVATLVVGVLMLLAIVLTVGGLGLYPLTFLASVVVGVLTVILVQRVARAGWIATA